MRQKKPDIFDWDAVKASSPYWQDRIETDIRRAEAIHRYLTETPCPYCGQPYISSAGGHLCLPAESPGPPAG